MPLSVFPNSPVVDNKLLERLSKVSSSAVSDALMRLQIVDGGCLPGSIQCMNGSGSMVGTATTVFAPNGTSMALHLSMLTHARNHILVVATNEYNHNAYMGDIQGLLAQRNGCLGIILDGYIRDKEGVQSLDMPIFAKGSIPSHTVKEVNGAINAPISIGNVIINPGDVIIADCDGVVVIPRFALEKVLVCAEEKEIADANRQKRVAAFDFDSVTEITDYQNIIVKDVASYIEKHKALLDTILAGGDDTSELA